MRTDKIQYSGFRDYSTYLFGTDGSAWNYRGRKWKKLNPWKNWAGYRLIPLSKDGTVKRYFLHKIILECFKGPQPKGKETRHLDGDKENNVIGNLEWGTKKENGEDRVKHGTVPRGELAGRAKLNPTKVRAIRRKYQTGRYSLKRLGRIYKVSDASIKAVVARISWRHIP